jgi:hypothetical protein
MYAANDFNKIPLFIKLRNGNFGTLKIEWLKISKAFLQLGLVHCILVYVFDQ